MKPKHRTLLFLILFLIIGIIIGILASKYLPVFSPLSSEAVCQKGGYQDVRSCGGYFIAGKPCCDQGADIWNRRNQIVVSCGGYMPPPGAPESQCEKLLKNLDTKNCQELTCSPEDAKKIKSSYSLWEQTILFIRRFLSGNDASRAISTAVKVTPTPSPTATTDSTIDWKTYSNSKLGFSIQYPSNLRVSQEPQPYKNNLGGTTWLLSIDDRADGDVGGKTIKTSILVQFNDKPISGESGLPITKIENTVMGIENATYLNIQNYPAVKGRQKLNPDQNGVAQETTLFVTILRDKLLWSITGDIKSTKDVEINTVDQILSTFKFTGISVTPTSTPTVTPTTKPKTTYIVPTSWKRLTTQSGLNLCMPPKWEVEAYDHIIFNRDEGYKPSITYITNLPYSGGSRREAYFTYWIQEYPDVKQLVSVADTDINGNSALTIYPANSSDPKTSPEGLTVVWFSAGKLWKAGLSGWNMTNTSQTSFLKDFYTMISCSF